MAIRSAFGAKQRTAIILFAGAAMCAASTADAAVVISSAPTTNITCTGGVCTPSKKGAVLNVTQLQTMLASGNVTVTTAGAKASDVLVSAGISWASGSTLTLDAYQSITVSKPISVTGTGGLTIVTNDGGTGGTFSFGGKGNVNFWSLSDTLKINAIAYTLVGNIATLASDIASASGAGSYALAASYNAQPDGTYPSSPIPTTFTGNLEGLGNTISNLSIVDTTSITSVGLFTEATGTIENLNLSAETISVQAPTTVGGLVANGKGQYFGDTANVRISGGDYSFAGGLVGELSGSVRNSHTSGAVKMASNDEEGGLVGESFGSIDTSYATVKVVGEKDGSDGGLVGLNGGTVTSSYATGAVSGTSRSALGGLMGGQNGTVSGSYATGAVSGGQAAVVGGLAGADQNSITNSYATGSVIGDNKSDVGGLIGVKEADTGYSFVVSASYSTGAVTGGASSMIGGLVGDDQTSGQFSDSDWDTTTSGIGQGAGNINNDPGIAGLTSTQLQSGLPNGFSSAIWGESSDINGGLPYLLALPPA